MAVGAPHQLDAPHVFGGLDGGRRGVVRRASNTMVGWWGDVIREAQYKGDQYPRVCRSAIATA